MIDLHMILLGDEPQDLLARCLNSLADEPVNLHIVKGLYGHIGYGRAAGFKRGISEFVAYVDPDDYVIPGIYKECADMLSSMPDVDAVYAHTGVESSDGITMYETDLHHMCVYRRRYVEKVLPQIEAERFVPERHLEPVTLRKIGLEKIGYIYSQRVDSKAKEILKKAARAKGAYSQVGITSGYSVDQFL